MILLRLSKEKTPLLPVTKPCKPVASLGIKPVSIFNQIDMILRRCTFSFVEYLCTTILIAIPHTVGYTVNLSSGESGVNLVKKNNLEDDML